MLLTSLRVLELVSARTKPVSVSVVACHIEPTAPLAAAQAPKCFTVPNVTPSSMRPAASL